MPRRPAAVAAAVVAAALAVGMLAGCGGTPTGTSTGPSTGAAPGPSAMTSTGPSASRPGTFVTITSADIPAPEPAAPALAPDAPARIVSLATGVGETLAALGVGDRVVGRDETSEAPAIDAAPVLTKAHAVSAEKVLATDPDVVIVDAGTSPPEALDLIRSAGVTVVDVPEAWSSADIPARTLAVSRAVGVPDDVAAEVIAQAQRGGTATSTAAAPRVAFLYLRGTSAVYLLGGEGSGADDLIAAAGGVDVGAEAGLAAFTPLTAEALAGADPDVLLVMTKGLESVGGLDGLVALPGVAQTRAGREGRVVAVDDTLLLSFGPRTGALVDALSGALTQVSG